MTKRRKVSRGWKPSSRSSSPPRTGKAGCVGSKGKLDVWLQVLREIRQSKTCLVTTHANPDGDALGSALALSMGLKALRKKVTVYNKDVPQRSLQFLPGVKGIVQTLDPNARFDLAFVTDCAEMERVSEDFKKHPGIKKRIVVDHHAKSSREGDINLIDGGAASSGVVVLKLLKKLRVPVTRSIATAIYCTLVTDTGNFRYSNTDAETFQIAHDLVKKGVRPWDISRALYENYPVQRLKLMGSSFNTLQLHHGDRTATLELTQSMLKETGATKDLAEDFITFARGIDTVEVAVQFRETEEGWKMSLRSKNYVDVAEICRKFGGGGHVRAAGCKSDGSLEEIKTRLLAEIQKELDKISSAC